MCTWCCVAADSTNDIVCLIASSRFGDAICTIFKCQVFSLLFDSIGQVCHIIIFAIQVEACTVHTEVTWAELCLYLCAFFWKFVACKCPRGVKSSSSLSVLLLFSALKLYANCKMLGLHTVKTMLNYGVGLWCVLSSIKGINSSTAWHSFAMVAHSTILWVHIWREWKKRTLHQQQRQ